MLVWCESLPVHLVYLCQPPIWNCHTHTHTHTHIYIYIYIYISALFFLINIYLCVLLFYQLMCILTLAIVLSFDLIYLFVLRSFQENIITNRVMGLQNIQFLRSYSYSDALGFGNNFDGHSRIYFLILAIVFLRTLFMYV